MHDLLGMWNVVSSPNFERNYLDMVVSPYIKFERSNDMITGEYHIGLQSGDIMGRHKAAGVLVFEFDGMDRMDTVAGRGEAICQGDRLIFRMVYDRGDNYTFECERGYE